MVIKIAEIGINHNGDLEIAKKLMALAKSAGMDYVKYQKRTIDLVYSREELDKYRESPWGTTNRAQKEGLELDFDAYCEIDRYCRAIGIKWIASVWDVKSADMIAEFSPEFMKIPSALITYKELLEKLKSLRIPLIVSIGMSTEKEIDDVVKFFGKQIKYILHCTSTYPCSPNEINLSYIPKLVKKYPEHKIGFSNHSPDIVYIPVAVAFGAEAVEFHVTLDRAMYGTDQAASIEPEDMFRIGRYVKNIQFALGDGKKVVYDSELPIIKKLRRY